jgi:hypothetical protein
MNMFFFFEKLNILCIFRNRFFDPVLFRFFSGSGSVPFFGVDRFDDRFGSCNIVPNITPVTGVTSSKALLTLVSSMSLSEYNTCDWSDL